METELQPHTNQVGSKARQERGPVAAYLLEQGISELAIFRSSGPEDSNQHTAAGLFHSEFQFLETSDENLSHSIYEVLSSAFTKNAHSFYDKVGLKAEPIALVVQVAICPSQGEHHEFLRNHWAPMFSGIIDTADPHRVRIDVIRGLPTAAVGGCRSITYFVDRETKEITRHGKTYRHEAVFQEDDKSAHVDGFNLIWPRYVAPSHDLLRSLAGDALRMERDGLGVDVEFALAASDDTPVYLQRRPIQRYSADFVLPTTKELQSAIETSSIIGQATETNQQLFFTKTVLQPRWGSSLGKEAERLAEFNQRSPEGFIWVLQFDEVGGPEKYFRDWQRKFPSHIYSNARGIVVVDSLTEAKRDGGGLQLTSHFAQFLRSEGIPLMFLNIDQGQQLLRAIKRQDMNRSLRQRMRYPNFMNSVIRSTGIGSSFPIRLKDPLTVAVDQVQDRGIVGFGAPA